MRSVVPYRTVLVLLLLAQAWGKALPATASPTTKDRPRRAESTKTDDNHKTASLRVLIAVTGDPKLKHVDLDHLVDSPAVWKAVCADGSKFQTVTDLRPSDDILVVIGEFSPSDACDNCRQVIPLRLSGIDSPDDIRIFVDGYMGEHSGRAEILEPKVQTKVSAAVSGGFRSLRLHGRELMSYTDASGEVKEVQHGQIVRLEIKRTRQSYEHLTEGVAGIAKDSSGQLAFPLWWEFRAHRRWSWTRIQSPSLVAYSFHNDAWRAMPRSVATGIRLGIGSSFPQYIDLQAYAAPGLKFAGADSAETVSFGAGVEIEFGGVFGIGAGLDWESPHLVLGTVVVSAGDMIRKLLK